MGSGETIDAPLERPNREDRPIEGSMTESREGASEVRDTRRSIGSDHGFMVAMHTGSNVGYAIAPLERAFLRVARALVSEDARIHFAYRNLLRGYPDTLPSDFENVVALDIRDRTRASVDRIERYVRDNRIRVVLAFDAPVSLPSYSGLRRGGVRVLVSYLGAPMSSLNRGMRLILKQLDVRLRRRGPDHYVFESEAMRRTAIRGRGVPVKMTSVVRLGVDGDQFRPGLHPGYVHAAFAIPRDRAVVVYAGHMEPRKGVHVIVQAAVELIRRSGRRDVHFLFLGNRMGEERAFLPLYEGTAAAEHITFGGYRDDLPEIFGGCDIGCIASTGWDSFPRSSLEMAAAELPLVVSSLQGLPETVENGVTGLIVPPNDPGALAEALLDLLQDRRRRRAMAVAARDRVLRSFTVERQVEDLARTVRDVWVERARR